MSPPEPEQEQPVVPSPRAEIVLLTMLAIDPERPHPVDALMAMTDLLAIERAELLRHLQDLRAQELVTLSDEATVVHLTPHAQALLLELAEERLTDNMLRQRPLQEQAEALVIWRLRHPDTI